MHLYVYICVLNLKMNFEVKYSSSSLTDDGQINLFRKLLLNACSVPNSRFSVNVQKCRVYIRNIAQFVDAVVGVFCDHLDESLLFSG